MGCNEAYDEEQAAMDEELMVACAEELQALEDEITELMRQREKLTQRQEVVQQRLGAWHSHIVTRTANERLLIRDGQAEVRCSNI